MIIGLWRLGFLLLTLLGGKLLVFFTCLPKKIAKEEPDLRLAAQSNRYAQISFKCLSYLTALYCVLLSTLLYLYGTIFKACHLREQNYLYPHFKQPSLTTHFTSPLASLEGRTWLNEEKYFWTLKYFGSFLVLQTGAITKWRNTKD